MKKSPVDSTALRVLVSGHLPPPMGGIAAYCKELLASSLPGKVNLRFVVTSSQERELSSSGKASFANLRFAVRDLARFWKALREHRPQVSHIATVYGLSFVKHSVCVALARLYGSKVLLHPHCSITMLYTEKPKWWQWYFRQVARLLSGVIGLSAEWQQLKQYIPNLPVYEVPNAINLEPFQAIAEQHLSQPVTEGAVKMLYLGYIGKAKGSFDLVSAARLAQDQAPGLQVDLVGSALNPGSREQVQAQAEALGATSAQVRAPAYAQEKLEYFRGADVFVYPSYHEGMPMAVLEAMACALPVIATRVGGLPDLVTNGENGLLVEAGQPEQLADAMARLANDPALRRAMQQKSYQLMRARFDMEQRVSRLIEIYQATAAALALTAQPAPVK
jgi:glycosyltransferase involved in cell wall biosynthesis